jgi:hypothetical protein
VNITELATDDLEFTLEDNAEGFGWLISVTDPSGQTNVGPLYGSYMDIGLAIDPDTGMLVSGQRATIALKIESLSDQGLGIPQAIADESKKPWVVVVTDTNSVESTFKVSSSQPDRIMGLVTCTLEEYKS